MKNIIVKMLSVSFITLTFVSIIGAGNIEIVVTEKTITVNDTLIVPPDDPVKRFFYENYKLINIIPGEDYVILECDSNTGSCGESVRLAMDMLSNL